MQDIEESADEVIRRWQPGQSKPKNPAAVSLGRLGGLASRKRSRESYVLAGRAGGLAPHKKRKSKQQEESK